MTTMTKTSQKTTAGSSPKLTTIGFTNQMPSTHQKKKTQAKMVTVTLRLNENHYVSLQDKYNEDSYAGIVAYGSSEKRR